MPNEKLAKQAVAQAIYLTFITKEARKKVELLNKSELAFDPQGRVLVDVELSDEAIKQYTKETLGFKPTPTVTVSLDISDLPVLYDAFKAAIQSALTQIGVDTKTSETIVTRLDEQPKGSIIALQQEFHFHLSLACRVYQSVSPALKGKDKEMQKAHHETMLEVNKLVMASYAQALKKALKKDGSLDISKLNKALDKARKDILPQAHSLLMLNIIKNTGVILDKKTLKGCVDPDTNQFIKIKKIAEKTTATPNDLLHTDNKTQLVTWIAGSENTSHERREGDELADRQIVTLVMGESEQSKNPRLQIRTPSPVVKEGLKDDQAYIDDVVKKLQHVRDKYELETVLTGTDAGLPKAFVYNSYTAINNTVDDLLTANLQTQSAIHILRGAHEYNQAQLTERGNNAVFCLVQNISVNGFGDSLGYGKNPLQQETTLMAELALLHTLYDSASDADKGKIDGVFEKYKEYLKKDQHSKPSYFSETNEGMLAIEYIQGLKQSWKTNVDLADVPTVKRCIRQLMAHDLHCTHEYAKLVQALSVYAEPVSLGGCKSGNERAQAINGRVAILDAVFNPFNKLTTEEQLLKHNLQRLVGGSTTVRQDAHALKTALDTAYNATGLQTAPSMISLVDQGGPAKVEAKGFISTSTNQAEEKKSVMTNLSQEKASAMQAHKKLTKSMAGSWDEPRRPWYTRLFDRLASLVSGFLSLFGYQNTPPKPTVKELQNIALADFLEANPSSTSKDLMEQISHYKQPQGIAKTFVTDRIGEDIRNNYLYAGIEEYKQRRDKDVPPDYYRKLFVQYVTGDVSNTFMRLDRTTTQPDLVTINLKDLLKDKGAELYKLALEEEMNSEEYRDAVFQASTQHIEGAKWTQRLALIIAGPSASGKSFATTPTVKKASEFLTTDSTDQTGNDVICVDGGVGRDVSQMRKLAIQVANKRGYSGIQDLHDKSKVLTGLREIILNTALQSSLGVVIPETFSKIFDPSDKLKASADDKVRRMMRRIDQLKDTVQVFARVDSQNKKQFKDAVELMGSKRAWLIDWKTYSAGETPNKYDLNGKTTESKEYNAKGFGFGYRGSILAETWYRYRSKDKHCLVIENDLIILKPDGDHWVKAKKGDLGADAFSESVFEQWKTLDQNTRLPFEEYHRKNASLTIKSLGSVDDLRTIRKYVSALRLQEKKLLHLINHLKREADIDHAHVNAVFHANTSLQERKKHFKELISALTEGNQQFEEINLRLDEMQSALLGKYDPKAKKLSEQISTIKKYIDVDIKDCKATLDKTQKNLVFLNSMLNGGKPFLHRVGITREICDKKDIANHIEKPFVDNETGITVNLHTENHLAVDKPHDGQIFLYKVEHQHDGKIYKGCFTEENLASDITDKSLQTHGLPKKFEIREFPKPKEGELDDSEAVVAARVTFSLKVAHEILISMDKPADKNRPLQIKSRDPIEARYLWTALLFLDKQNSLQNRKISADAIKVTCPGFVGEEAKGIMGKFLGYTFRSNSLYYQVFKKDAHKECISEHVKAFNTIVAARTPPSQADFKEIMSKVRDHKSDTDTDSDNNSEEFHS